MVLQFEKMNKGKVRKERQCSGSDEDSDFWEAIEKEVRMYQVEERERRPMDGLKPGGAAMCSTSRGCPYTNVHQQVPSKPTARRSCRSEDSSKTLGSDKKEGQSGGSAGLRKDAPDHLQQPAKTMRRPREEDESSDSVGL